MINLFAWYSYAYNVFFSILNLLPPPIRKIIFKLLLGSYHLSSYIDYRVYIRYPSKLYIGEKTTINRGCKFFNSFHFKDVTITIGNRVAIAPGVIFLAAGHDYTQLSLPDTAASICIKDDVWIGYGSKIMAGVTIGQGAVVAAGSLVTKNVEPYTVVAGIPSKYIKKRVIKSKDNQGTI